MNTPPTRNGAYGFSILGTQNAGSLFVLSPAHWPPLEVRSTIDLGPGPDSEEFSEEAAILRLRSGGWVVVDRRTMSAEYHLPGPASDAAMVHPHLSSAAVVSAYWLGRESFHAGGLVAGGGVWGVLGEREAGKSTLLASAALSGLQVFADDLLVLDGRTALAGPRSIDLRAGAAERLGVGEPLGRIGNRDRWRLALADTAPELPLMGWVSLRWSDETAVRALRGSERLRRLAVNRAFLLTPRDPAELLALAALPFFELARPQDWSASQDALEGLRRALERQALDLGHA